MRAQAAHLSNLSNTISTSKPGAGANHTIVFTTPSGVPADGSTIEILIPDGFSIASINEDDVDVQSNGVDLTTGASCGAVQAAVSTSGQTIAIEICSGGGGAIAPGSEVTIKIGTHAEFSGTGTNQIINHALPGDYPLYIGGTMTDRGATRLVILEAVTVSGNVDTFFNFEIHGVDAGQSVNADETLTFATTTATSVAYGVVAHGNEYLLAQDLSVTTNSRNGFMVRVFADGDLESSTGATINSFSDGTGVETPTAWAPPSRVPGDADTYGHWGLTTEDQMLSDDDSFGDALYVGNFISDPREVMFSTSSADGTTPHIGSTRVGYKLEISIMQEAATDYSTKLTYIATPVF